MNNTSSNDTTPSAAPIPQEEIAACAYHLFLERGGEHGNDWQDWFRAEALLREEQFEPAVERAVRSEVSETQMPLRVSPPVRMPQFGLDHNQARPPVPVRDTVRRQKVPPAARQLASSHVEH